MFKGKCFHALWAVLFVFAGEIFAATLDEGGFVEYPGPEGTLCARGEPYSFFVRHGDPKKVVVDFVGGGACWSEETCSVEGAIFTDSVDTLRQHVKDKGLLGIYDSSNLDNPIREWTHVVIPYCTGDIHWGDNTVTYGSGDKAFTIHHKGAVNARGVLNWMGNHLTDPQKILVTGTSAGAYGSIYWTPQLASLYPTSQIFQMGDSGAGVITDSFKENSFPLWKAWLNAPVWIDGLNPDRGADWTKLSVGEIYVHVGEFYPQIKLSQFNTAFDSTQVFFYEAMGGGDEEEWSESMVDHLSFIRSGLNNFYFFLAPGINHTILPEGYFYSTETRGERFRDWFSDLIEAREIKDVECDICDPL